MTRYVLRYNLSHLEQWIRDSKLQDSGAIEVLEPIIQVAQLLQARKTDKDIKSICEMCPKLTIAQVNQIFLHVHVLLNLHIFLFFVFLSDPKDFTFVHAS
jgi:hypothetical protein